MFHSPFDILLTVGGEDNFNECLIDNLRCRIDQLQDIRTVVVVPEEQQPVRQLGQAIVRELDVEGKKKIHQNEETHSLLVLVSRGHKVKVG